MEPENQLSLTGTVTVPTGGSTSFGISPLTTGTTYIDYNQIRHLMAQQSLQYVKGNTTVDINEMHYLSMPIPCDAVPVARRIYPDQHYSLYKRDGRYFINRQGRDIYTEAIEMNTVSSKYGVTPEHLLAVAEDHLSCFEELSEEQQQAVKHIKYALAFLEKHTLSHKK